MIGHSLDIPLDIFPFSFKGGHLWSLPQPSLNVWNCETRLLGLFVPKTFRVRVQIILLGDSYQAIRTKDVSYPI